MGIAKINYYTQTSVAAVERVRNVLRSDPDLISYPQLLQEARGSIKDEVARQMLVFGSAGICTRFPDICVECEACTVPNRPLQSPGPAQPPAAPPDPDRLVEAVTRAVIAVLKEGS